MPTTPTRSRPASHDDFFNEHTSSIGTSLRGRSAYRERLDGFLAQFHELRYEVEDVLVDGERAAVAYRMHFSWRGDDGVTRPITIRGIFRFHIVDGAIAHRVDYWDSADFTRQATAPVEMRSSEA